MSMPQKIAKSKDFFTTRELAEFFGVSRITIFNRIKKGEVAAIRVGRNYLIPKEKVFGHELKKEEKAVIEAAVKKTVAEYGETLKLLGNS